MLWSPPGYCATVRHSRIATQPSSTGAPVLPDRWGIPWKACGPSGRVAELKKRERGSWSAARMLTAKTPLASSTACEYRPRSMQTRTRGGSSDSEAKAFTVTPWGPSRAGAVTTVTPVAKRARASRNSSGDTRRSPPIAAPRSELHPDADRLVELGERQVVGVQGLDRPHVRRRQVLLGRHHLQLRPTPAWNRTLAMRRASRADSSAARADRSSSAASWRPR